MPEPTATLERAAFHQRILDEGLLLRLLDNDLDPTLAERVLDQIAHFPATMALAAEVIRADALVKSAWLAESGEELVVQPVRPASGAVTVEAFAPGERLTKDLYDPSGNLLLMRGTLLSENVLNALKSKGITTVYLGVPPANIPSPEPFPLLTDEPRPHLYFTSAEIPADILPREAGPHGTETVPDLEADIVYRIDETEREPLVNDLPTHIPEGFFFGQPGAPRKFHKNDYRDLLMVAQPVPAIAQATKLKAYSQLERSLGTLKEAGLADLGPIRQTTTQIVDELLRDERKGCSLADLFLVSSQLFSHAFNTLVTFTTIARALEIPAADLLDAGECVLFHDIGRILPLNPGEDRASAYETHTLRGETYLLGQGGFAPSLLRIVRNHHERYDGKGFPQGLWGEQLSLLDQVLILANTYDTLVTDPVHGVKRSFHRAAQAILQSGGRLVSTEVTNAFLNVFGMYPPGSVVQLASRELAVVREANFGRPFQPQVTVFADPQGARLAAPYFVDLTAEKLVVDRALEVDAVLEY